MHGLLVQAYMGCFEMSTSSRPTWKSQAGSANEVPSCSYQLVFLMKPAVCVFFLTDQKNKCFKLSSLLHHAVVSKSTIGNQVCSGLLSFHLGQTIRCQCRVISQVFHGCRFIALQLGLSLQRPSPWRYLERHELYKSILSLNLLICTNTWHI